jgi:hypothetical protein
MRVGELEAFGPWSLEIVSDFGFRVSDFFPSTLTVGSTDIPGPNGNSGLGGSSKRIFTGTRCTTLT